MARSMWFLMTAGWLVALGHAGCSDYSSGNSAEVHCALEQESSDHLIEVTSTSFKFGGYNFSTPSTRMKAWFTCGGQEKCSSHIGVVLKAIDHKISVKVPSGETYSYYFIWTDRYYGDVRLAFEHGQADYKSWKFVGTSPTGLTSATVATINADLRLPFADDYEHPKEDGTEAFCLEYAVRIMISIGLGDQIKPFSSDIWTKKQMKSIIEYLKIHPEAVLGEAAVYAYSITTNTTKAPLSSSTPSSSHYANLGFFTHAKSVDEIVV